MRYIIDYLTVRHMNPFGVYNDYLMYKGKAIDLRNRKYKIWRKLFAEGRFNCQSCKTPVDDIRLEKCKGAGSIYKLDGSTKYTFMIYGNNKVMTIDHWIPKSFLRHNGLNWNLLDNLVIMCTKCNKFKANLIPFNWKELYRKMDGSTILSKKMAYA